MAGKDSAPNLVGEPLDPSVVEQLRQRGLRLTQAGVRSGTDIRALTQKNAWVRLSSFVNVLSGGVDEISKNIGGEFPVQKGTYIARDWVLKAEDRMQTATNGEGALKFGVKAVSGAYGTGGINELGYRPMPGIYSVQVESQPPRGTIRSATVKFKAWNLNQLSIIDIIYFRLGFSMLLEWGHSVFTDNKGRLINGPIPIEIFKDTAITKESVLRQLEKKRKEYSHNYDGMLGVVTNYEWTQAPDGSYDCTLKLSGIGSVMESLKINTQEGAPGVIAAEGTNSPQTAVKNESALSVFLNTIQNSYATNLLDTTYWNNLFSAGLNSLNNPSEAFQYGYNTKYLVRGSATAQTPKADLGALTSFLKADIVALDGANKTPQPHKYITLATILAFLNNSCILYDKSNGTAKPAIYIDFNQNTNFCLRIPQQFSIDPSVCLIDTDCSQDSYNKLYTVRGIDISKVTAPAAPSSGKLMSLLANNPAKYIDPNDQYKGKFMNILVNVQCALDTLAENTDEDKNVFLSAFLDSLMGKIQRALGNINVFKVGYDETANAVTIYDDQVVDADTKQKPIPTIPVFGLQSTLREYNLKTEVSSRLGSLLAITARAGARNTGTNKDSAAFTALNRSLEDRLLKDLDTSPTSTTSTSGNTTSTAPSTPSSGFELIANTFNTQIGLLYEITSQNISYDVQSVESIQNFYIDSMLQIKGTPSSNSGKIDSVAATGVLPLALNMTVDGIGGVGLYQAFTVPANRLPAQYVSNGKPRIGFTIAGLDHTIENNQWVTKIRALMINIPNERRISTPTFVANTNTRTNPQRNTNVPPSTPPSAPSIKGNPDLAKVIIQAGYAKGSALYTLALTIGTKEGWSSTANNGIGSRSYRNNNPGNLAFSKEFISIDPGATVESNPFGGRNRFAKFTTAELGVKALVEGKLKKWANGNMPITTGNQSLISQSEKYKAGTKPTLAQFMYTYAPPNENNTEGYLSTIISSITTKPVSRSTLLLDVLT